MSDPSSSVFFPKLEAVAETALLHEALGKRGALTHTIKPVYPGAQFLGRALTIKSAPGDNLMLHVAVAAAQPGDVLIASVDGFLEAGIWGDLATVAAQVRGVRGLVTDGAVRDVNGICALKFPVFAAGISIKGTTKKQRGQLNCPVCIGGVLVYPGDYVVGDTDGVVIIPAAEVEQTIAKAHEIRQREERIIERLRAGELTLDLLGLRPLLQELGLDHNK